MKSSLPRFVFPSFPFDFIWVCFIFGYFMTLDCKDLIFVVHMKCVLVKKE